uniref:Uncharacterized protein n=1 Tax=Leersia perrieri TaxID=77586 RepID=A0A0D9WXD1_9ORYZ
MPPAASSGGGRRRRWAAGDSPRSEKRPRDPEDSESEPRSDGGSSGLESDDGDFVSDLKEIVCLLRLIKGGANKDGQKMCEEIITSVAADIQTMLEETKLRFEKERQNFLKVLSNTSKECDSSLSKEYIKFQETYEIFCMQKDVHVQAFRDLFSKVEVEKKALFEQYQHHRKEETATLSELDNTFSNKIKHAEQSLRRSELDNFLEKKAHAEQSVRRMKKHDKSFIILRKSVGSFLEFGSDDDFDLDDD